MQHTHKDTCDVNLHLFVSRSFVWCACPLSPLTGFGKWDEIHACRCLFLNFKGQHETHQTNKSLLTEQNVAVSPYKAGETSCRPLLNFPSEYFYHFSCKELDKHHYHCLATAETFPRTFIEPPRPPWLNLQTICFGFLLYIRPSPSPPEADLSRSGTSDRSGPL